MSHNIYPYPWPIGTCHYNQLPQNIQDSMSAFIVNGMVSDTLPVYHTATEGPYISYAGWKIRVIIEDTSLTTFIVRIV